MAKNPNEYKQKNPSHDPSVIIDELLALKGTGNHDLVGFFEDVEANNATLGSSTQIAFNREQPYADTVLALLRQCRENKQKIIDDPVSYRDAMVTALETIASMRETLGKGGITAELGNTLGGLVAAEADFFKDIAITVEDDPELIAITDRVPVAKDAKSQRRDPGRVAHETSQDGMMLRDAYAKLYELAQALKIRLPHTIRPPETNELQA